MVRKISLQIFVLLSIASCSSQFDVKAIENVYVQDFQSTEIDNCTQNDVNLSHADSAEFFRLARLVDSKVIHDHYNHAPCYIEGTLLYNGKICDWEIRAGKTAMIKCQNEEYNFICDSCESLFEKS